MYFLQEGYSWKPSASQCAKGILGFLSSITLHDHQEIITEYVQVRAEALSFRLGITYPLHFSKEHLASESI